MEVTHGAYESPKCPLQLSVSKDTDTYLKIRIYEFLRILVSSSVAVSEWWLSQPNLKIFLGELQVYDMKFETAKYEHSLHAKSFVRTAVFGGGSILAVDFLVSEKHQLQAPYARFSYTLLVRSRSVLLRQGTKSKRKSLAHQQLP